MYRHYGRRGTASFIVDVALTEIGLPSETITIGRDPAEPATATYRRRVPSGKVPALELPDGTLVTESAAILLVLDERHPEAGLLPPPRSSARAVALRWLLWGATEVYQHDLRFYYPERYTTDPNGAPGVKAAALAGMRALFAQLDRELADRTWVTGDGWTIIDAYLLMLVTWVPDHEAMLADLPALARVFGACGARPSVSAALATHAGY